MSAQPMEEHEESLAAAGERIRREAPILGDRATDEDCRVRRELISQALQARGVRAGEHAWHTAQLVDGRVVGVWADSVEEAELSLTVWWDGPCHWVRPDPDCRIRAEYFPPGKQSAAHAARVFPLTGPRRPRDRFEPAASLLGPLTADGWTPTHPTTGLGGVR